MRPLFEKVPDEVPDTPGTLDDRPDGETCQYQCFIALNNTGSQIALDPESAGSSHAAFLW
jgi:hypothetical protein